jgi:hypothetical protein
MQSTRNARIVSKTTGAQITAPVMPAPVLDFFRANGRIGGSAKSPAKAKAARRNGKLGGKPGGPLRNQQEALPKSEVIASIQGSKDSSPHLRD